MAKNDNKSFREAVDARLDGLSMSEEMKRDILAKKDAPPARKAVRFPRRGLMIAAACLALVFCVGMAAAVLMDFERFIGRMGEDMREVVQEVSAHTTAEGIRMDVLAAVRDEESVVAYVALTDEEGSRIGEDTEIYHASYDGMVHAFAPLVDYDEETQSAVFRIEAQAFAWTRTVEGVPASGSGDLIGDTVTLNLHSILSGRQWHEARDTGLTVADVLVHNPTPTLAQPQPDAFSSFGINWGSQTTLTEAMADQMDGTTLPLLQRGEDPLPSAWPYWQNIGNAGVMDGYLHLQHEPVDEAALYAQTYYTVTWPGAAPEPYQQLLSTITVDRGENLGDEDWYTLPEYQETILELPQGVPPEEIHLLAGGTTYQEHIGGTWSVSFALDDNPPTLRGACQVDMGSYVLNSITVSSIGVKAEGTEKEDVAPDAVIDGSVEIEVYLQDGTLVECDSSSISCDSSGVVTLKDSFNRPILLDAVDRLLINGQEIPLVAQQQ